MKYFSAAYFLKKALSIFRNIAAMLEGPMTKVHASDVSVIQ